MSDTIHVRLNDEEESFLDDFYGGSGSSFVHAAIKNERTKIDKNKNQNVLQRYSQSFIMIGLGAIFVLFAASTNNLIAFLMIFFLGVFFVVNGLSSIGWSVFKRWKKS